jgi:hypothetical protein
MRHDERGLGSVILLTGKGLFHKVSASWPVLHSLTTAAEEAELW